MTNFYSSSGKVLYLRQIISTWLKLHFLTFCKWHAFSFTNPSESGNKFSGDHKVP